jgi:hypothetical protein
LRHVGRNDILVNLTIAIVVLAIAGFLRRNVGAGIFTGLGIRVVVIEARYATVEFASARIAGPSLILSASQAIIAADATIMHIGQ